MSHKFSIRCPGRGDYKNKRSFTFFKVFYLSLQYFYLLILLNKACSQMLAIIRESFVLLLAIIINSKI
jgi:hypothetical protein